MIFAKASSLRGSTQNCAGPADAQRGVLRKRLGQPDLALRPDNFLQLLHHDELRGEFGQLFVHVARAETEHEIAFHQHSPDIAV
jgi:hypothetical protein